MAVVFGNLTSADGPLTGYTYRALVVRGERQRVLDRARALRLSGWVGPQEDGVVVCVPSGEHLLVAGGGRDLEQVAADLGDGGPALVVEVVRDRTLSLVLLRGDEEPLRYLSDPSVLDPDELDEPRGAHHAPVLARTWGVPRAADELRTVLSEWLDPEHYIESERLGRVLALLGLPAWLVSAWALPRRPSAGPSPAELTRLRRGVPGPVGLLLGRPTDTVRRLRQQLARRPDGPRPDGAGASGPGDVADLRDLEGW